MMTIIQHDLTKLTFKLIIFLSFFLAIDASAFVFKSPNSDVFSKISDEKMRETKKKLFQSDYHPDILIFGSSHAELGIDPAIISHELNASAYNLAFGGAAGTGNQYFLLKNYLKKGGEPRGIIYAIEVFSLKVHPISGASILKPLLHGDLEFLFEAWKQPQFAIETLGFQPKSFMYSPNIITFLDQLLQKGNSTLPLHWYKDINKSMFKSYSGYKIETTGLVRGFGIANPDYVREKDIHLIVQEKNVSYLKRFVNLCQQNHIDLLILQIPEHASVHEFAPKYQEFNDWMEKFSTKNNVNYINFNDKNKFPINKDEHFFDTDHLNSEGSKILTSQLAKLLREQNFAITK